MTINKDKDEIIRPGSFDQPPITKPSSRLLYPMIIKTLFLIGGLLFLSRVLQGTQALDLILAPVAIVLLFFITMTKPMINNKDKFSALALSIWIVVSYLITIQADIEILFILILVGLLIIQELSQEQLTRRFQKRLNIILFFFLMIFVVIVADKIHVILTS